MSRAKAALFGVVGHESNRLFLSTKEITEVQGADPVMIVTGFATSTQTATFLVLKVLKKVLKMDF